MYLLRLLLRLPRRDSGGVRPLGPGSLTPPGGVPTEMPSRRGPEVVPPADTRLDQGQRTVARGAEVDGAPRSLSPTQGQRLPRAPLSTPAGTGARPAGWLGLRPG